MEKHSQGLKKHIQIIQENTNMKIAVAGTGYVGLSMAVLWHSTIQ